MPPRHDEEIGIERAQPRRRARPGEGIQAVQDRLRRHGGLDRVLALVELGRAREEKSGIEAMEGDDRERVTRGEGAREERRVVGNAAAVRIGGPQDRRLHASP